MAKNLEDEEPPKGVKMTLVRLNKEFKAIEGSRITITEIMRRQLAKQWSQLIQLRNEYKNISAAFTEHKQLQADKNYVKEINMIINLLKRKMKMQDEENLAKQALSVVKDKLEQARKHFEELKLNDNRQFLDKIDPMETLHALEKRLFDATIELNKVVVVNSHLRQEVGYELRERAQFKAMYDFLLDEIVATTEIILDGTEDAALALDLRKEGMERNRFYGHCLRKRTIKHIAELRELRCEKNLIFRACKFHNTKTKQRRQRLQDPGSAQAELAAIQALENTTKKYENLYNEIIMLCGKNSMSIDEICEEYRSREDENFAIFSYINEVNHEGENINETIKILKKRMVLEMELKEEIVEKGNEYLDEVERDLKQIASIRNEIIKKRKSVDGHCSIMVQGFEKLYILIRGNLTSFSKTLVNSSKLDYGNLHFLLPVIQKQMYKIKRRIHSKFSTNEIFLDKNCDKDFRPINVRKKIMLREVWAQDNEANDQNQPIAKE
ncbi:coiled-coil domain containing protein 114 isoform X2 [Rhodnius prolixus]